MKFPVELKYITLAQIVGCCLVILGHSFPFVTPYPSGVSRCVTFLYTFHMPLFVWCSGFLFAHTMQSERKTFGQYAGQRAIRLLVPYFIISLIGLVPKILASSVLNDTLNMDLVSIVRAFIVPREGVWGHFWFLPMIYIIGVIGFACDKVSRKTVWWTGVALIAFGASFFRTDVLDWFGMNDVIQYFMFYSMGVICSRANLMTISEKSIWPIAVGGIVLAVVLFFCITSGAGQIHVRNTLMAMLMSYAIVQICRAWEKSSRIDRHSLIAQTYQIFILSWPCQLVMGIIVERILHMSWMVFIPSVFVTGVLGPLVLLLLIDWFERNTKTRYISFVLGR